MSPAFGALKFPKIYHLPDGKLPQFMNWFVNDVWKENEESSDSLADTNFSVIFRPKRTARIKRILAPVMGRGGWLEFQLLTVRTPPPSSYLLIAMFDQYGDWACSSLLETLLGGHFSIHPAGGPPRKIQDQLRFGIDGHREFSLLHWQSIHEQFVDELLSEHFRENASPGITWTPDEFLETCRHVQRLLQKERVADQGSEIWQLTEFYSRFPIKTPDFECERLCTIEWSVRT